MIKSLSSIATALLFISPSAFAGEAPEDIQPICSLSVELPYEQWDFSAEAGYLWQIGSNTSIDYELATAVFSLRSPVALTFLEQDNGNALVVRNRVTLITDYVADGPEDYIITLNGSPSIEYWFADNSLAFFFAPGGGVGITNSKGVSTEGGSGVEGGQGQDFVLNWFVHAGIRYQLSADTALTAGALFQHVSNGGQTDVNPGIDALGFTVGFTKTF